MQNLWVCSEKSNGKHGSTFITVSTSPRGPSTELPHQWDAAKQDHGKEKWSLLFWSALNPATAPGESIFRRLKETHHQGTKRMKFASRSISRFLMKQTANKGFHGKAPTKHYRDAILEQGVINSSVQSQGISAQKRIIREVQSRKPIFIQTPKFL